MARIRTLKPEFWPDEKLGHQSAITRLVFLGLISHADDAGRLVDSVKLIDGMLFPYTNDSCGESLEDLARSGRILRYRSESGQPLIQIKNWDKHQKVKNPSKYNLPAPPTEPLPQSSVEPGEDGSRTGGEPNAPTVYRIPSTVYPRPPTVGEAGGPTDEMLSELESYADRTVTEPAKRSRLIAKCRSIVSGEDATAWKNPEGSAVPWVERPRLFRLALGRLEAGESDNLRGALRYVIPQQLAPFETRQANGKPPNGPSPPGEQWDDRYLKDFDPEYIPKYRG